MKVKMGMGKRGVRFQEEERENGDYLVCCVQIIWYCCESEERLREIIGYIVTLTKEGSESKCR